MEKRYKIPVILFIIIIVLFILDRLINPFEKYVDDSTRHIHEIEVADSVINIASDQIDQVQVQTNKAFNMLDSLGNTVVLDKMTIDEQIIELNRLLKIANIATKEAQDQKDLALKFKNMAEISKVNANEHRVIAQIQYSKILTENDKLKDEIEKLNKQIDSIKFNTIDTLFIEEFQFAPIIEETKTKNRKNKKE